MTVNQALTGTWPGHVGTAISDWNAFGNSVLHLTAPTSGGSYDPKRCNPVTGQILVCNYAYGQRGWLGLASITADSSSHITSGTTKLNDSYFNMASYNKPAWRAMVACQEIGHDFGLAHQDEGYAAPNLGTCMDYTNDPSGSGAYKLSNEHPNAHDTAELNIIYGHTDAYSTTISATATNFGIRQVGKSAASSAGLPAVGDTRAEWGAATHRDGKGRPDMFVRALPGGGKQLTHVFWALEASGHEAD